MHDLRNREHQDFTRLTHQEEIFVQTVRNRPGQKLNSGEAWSVPLDAEGVNFYALWVVPQTLGLIKEVGSYKWIAVEKEDMKNETQTQGIDADFEKWYEEHVINAPGMSSNTTGKDIAKLAYCAGILRMAQQGEVDPLGGMMSERKALTVADVIPRNDPGRAIEFVTKLLETALDAQDEIGDFMVTQPLLQDILRAFGSEPSAFAHRLSSEDLSIVKLSYSEQEPESFAALRALHPKTTYEVAAMYVGGRRIDEKVA